MPIYSSKTKSSTWRRWVYDNIVTEQGDQTSFFPATLSTGTGSITLTSGADVLGWTREGNLVHVNGRLSVASVSSPTGGLTLGTLPFNSVDTSGQSGEVWFPVGIAAYTGTATDTPVGAGTNTAFGWFVGYIAEGTNEIEIRDGYDLGSVTSVAANIAAGTQLLFNFTYVTDDDSYSGSNTAIAGIAIAGLAIAGTS